MSFNIPEVEPVGKLTLDLERALRPGAELFLKAIHDPDRHALNDGKMTEGDFVREMWQRIQIGDVEVEKALDQMDVDCRATYNRLVTELNDPNLKLLEM